MTPAELAGLCAEVSACAASWEPDVRLIGNMRAADVERLAAATELLGAVLVRHRMMAQVWRDNANGNTNDRCAARAIEHEESAAWLRAELLKLEAAS